jgi:antitoxin CptB
MTTAPAALDPRRRRALYRATHRGTKEMDWFLGRYAEARLAAMADVELEQFERLLVMPDPDLHSWITSPDAIGASDFAQLVGDIRTFHGLGAE